jgi:hypothetical protein
MIKKYRERRVTKKVGERERKRNDKERKTEREE